jgi:hypothetical protein
MDSAISTRGAEMANQTQQAKAGSAKPTKPKFSEMSTGGKLAHIGKIVIFVVTFGFAYPSLFSD